MTLQKVFVDSYLQQSLLLQTLLSLATAFPLRINTRNNCNFAGVDPDVAYAEVAYADVAYAEVA